MGIKGFVLFLHGTTFKNSKSSSMKKFDMNSEIDIFFKQLVCTYFKSKIVLLLEPLYGPLDIVKETTTVEIIEFITLTTI